MPLKRKVIRPSRLYNLLLSLSFSSVSQSSWPLCAPSNFSFSFTNCHRPPPEIIQSCLCCLFDTTSTRPVCTSTSTAASGCSKPRRRGRSSVTLLVSTKRTSDSHSQVNCTSKIELAKRTSEFHSQVNSRCASKCTSVFHSQVNCTIKIVLANCDL